MNSYLLSILNWINNHRYRVAWVITIVELCLIAPMCVLAYVASGASWNDFGKIDFTISIALIYGIIATVLICYAQKVMWDWARGIKRAPAGW